MKINSLVLSLGGLAVLLAGCQNPDGTQNNTGSGVLIGGAMGALTGAAIGGHRHGGQDALIGAAAGAAAGGLIGNSMDRAQSGAAIQQAPPQPAAETVIVSPGPGYVWVGGEWAWNGRGWVWIGGHWIYPPRPGAVWVVGRSWHDRYGWHHERGYWR